MLLRLKTLTIPGQIGKPEATNPIPKDSLTRLQSEMTLYLLPSTRETGFKATEGPAGTELA